MFSVIVNEKNIAEVFDGIATDDQRNNSTVCNRLAKSTASGAAL
jgi:hypothetical protein